MPDIQLDFKIHTPDDWTLRETHLLAALTDRTCRLKMSEARFAGLREAVEVDETDTEYVRPTVAALMAIDYAAIQAGIDEVKRMFPGVEIQAKY